MGLQLLQGAPLIFGEVGAGNGIGSRSGTKPVHPPGAAAAEEVHGRAACFAGDGLILDAVEARLYDQSSGRLTSGFTLFLVR